MKLLLERWRQFIDEQDSLLQEGFGSFYKRAKGKLARMMGKEAISGRFTPYPEGAGNWVEITVPYSEADIENIRESTILFIAIVDKLHEELGFKEPVVTSGYRDGFRQATAMYNLWKNNGEEYVINLYTTCKSCNKDAGQTATEVVKLFNSYEDQNAAIQRAGDYINKNIISAHNIGNAIDYRFKGHEGMIGKILKESFDRGYVAGGIINETEIEPAHWHVTVWEVTKAGLEYLNTPNEVTKNETPT